MKKTVLLLFAAAGIMLLNSCQTTKEISIKDNGEGTMVTTTDMSGLIGLAKMAGKEDDVKKLNMNEKLDTTISLTEMADGLTHLTANEKAIIKKGKLGLNMDLSNEKLVTVLDLPFTNLSQIAEIDALSGKIAQEVLRKQIDSSGKELKEGDGELPTGSMDAYFTTTYSKGLIERKLDAEKYKNVESDEEMKGLKEMSGMGIMNNVLIFNLPKAAKKVTGKNAVLSEDKKKVTVTTSMEDFFDDATKLEYRIEY
jgi:hypothetical protein